MLTFTEAAERLVKDGIAQNMTAEGLRRLARDPASGWPIGPEDYRVVGKTRTLPYELLAPYMQARRRGRGPDKSGQRGPASKQRGESGVLKQQTEVRPLSGDARAILGIVWKWIADANDGRGSDVGDLMHELESAGYGPLEDE